MRGAGAGKEDRPRKEAVVDQRLAEEMSIISTAFQPHCVYLSPLG